MKLVFEFCESDLEEMMDDPSVELSRADVKTYVVVVVVVVVVVLMLALPLPMLMPMLLPQVHAHAAPWAGAHPRERRAAPRPQGK